MKHHDFFKDLVLTISSSLELPKAWQATFRFLAKQMPIDGISLHSFDPDFRSLHLQFLVTKDNYFQLDTLIPLSDAEVKHVLEIETVHLLSNIPRCNEMLIAAKHNRAMCDYLPFRDRGYLVGILRTDEGVVGHLCLIGKEGNCFTKEHEQLLKLMQPPLSLAMMNMLQHRRTQELRRRLDEQRQQLEGEVSLLKDSSIIGAHGGLHATMETVEQLAGKETPVLILGETGTGKELIADTVQRISPRANGPYVKVNCGAIPETLIDSELFGYQKGAFTGALSNKAGRFEQADGGTLFLDEIGELPLQAQVRLLRVLQNSTVERVGGDKSIPVDVRIIAATNRPLENMLRQGSFREDLFYRLNVFPIKIPPLRERTEDIPLLIHHFIRELSSRLKLSDNININADTLQKVQSYSWPGNVRELKNLVERGLTISPRGPLDLGQYLPKDPGWYVDEEDKNDYLRDLVREQVTEILAEQRLTSPQASEQESVTEQRLRTEKTLDEVMAEHIRQVVALCNGKISGPGGAAERLAINPSTLRKRMEKLQISFNHFK